MQAILDSLDTSVLSACLSTVCGDMHFLPAWHFKHCNPIQVMGAVDGFGTWVPCNSEPLVLFRMEFGTIIWVQGTDMVYHAMPDYCLNCPVGIGLLGRFVLDEGRLPRVLVYDVICGPELSEVPEDRYCLLQRSNWLHGSGVSLQWCGQTAALRASLLDKSFSPPHAVEAVCVLTANPCQQGLVPIK